MKIPHTQDTISTIIRMYCWPSQSLWRVREISVLKTVSYQRPILEIGCGASGISGLILDRIEDAIDMNPRAVERTRLIAGPNGPLYGRVRCMNATNLDQELPSSFGTILANCVMEHVNGLEPVLKSCHSALRPGGQLVLTVPLLEMNNHMALRSRWYTNLRQRQLCHVNLFSREQWARKLGDAGFEVTAETPYLYPGECRFWDRIDAIGSVGIGRYQVATATAFFLRLFPKLRDKQVRLVDRMLRSRINDFTPDGPPCASLLVAERR